MRICIFGAGAVGGAFAARLGDAGFDVSAIARGEQLQAIQADGIRLETPDRRYEARIAASDAPADLGVQDAILFATKAHSLKAVAAAAAALIGPETALVFAQNGIPWWYGHGFEAPGLDDAPIPLLDADGAIWNGFGPERATGAVIHSPNALIAPGVVRSSSPRPSRLLLGEPAGGPLRPNAERLRLALEAAGILSPPVPDIRLEVWNKLILNVGAAPCSSLTGGGLKSYLQDEGMRRVAFDAMSEGAAVAKAHGFDLDVDIARQTDPANRPDHKPSILQDLEAGRTMEVDPILGCVQAFGHAAGVATPTIDVLLPLLRTRARLAGLYYEQERPA